MFTFADWVERHPVPGFVVSYASGLSVFFVLQCLIRGWAHWGSALVSTLVFGVLMGTFQYFYVLRPKLQAREQEK